MTPFKRKANTYDHRGVFKNAFQGSYGNISVTDYSGDPKHSMSVYQDEKDGVCAEWLSCSCGHKEVLAAGPDLKYRVK